MLANITERTLITHRGETRAVRAWAAIACLHPAELVRRLREGQTLAEACEPPPPPEPRALVPRGRPASGSLKDQRRAHAHFELWAPDDIDERTRIVEELPLAEDELTQYFLATHPGGATLEEVADFLGITRERVRQLEHAAVLAAKRRAPLAGLHHHLEDA